MSDDRTTSDRGDDSGIARRSYLQLAAMAGGIGAFGGSAFADTARAQEAENNYNYTLEARLEDAYERRVADAQELIRGLTPRKHRRNDDDELTWSPSDGGGATHPMTYSKGTVMYDGREDYGVPDEENNELFLRVFDEGSNWDELPKGELREFVSPVTSHSFPTDGMESWLGTMPPAPNANSQVMAAELLDTYWMAILRDETLGRYSDDDLLADMREDYAEIGVEPWFEISQNGLFRGVFDGAKEGIDYVSRFLQSDVEMGAIRFSPEVDAFAQQDYGVTQSDWADIVRGTYEGGAGAEPGPQPGPEDPSNSTERIATTGRDLAALVREDPSYQYYSLAALQLLGDGVEFDENLPWIADDTAFPYIDHGAPRLLGLLARTTQNALEAAFHHKWRVHRRIRPETYAGRVHHHRSGTPDFEEVLPSSLAGADLNALDILRTRNGTYFLPLAYPEGSPAHPAYPSGHSTIAGACATVLKTFFQNEDRPIGGIHSEINKLASNIGLARMFAGVHYITDHVWGARLGEQVAVATMLDVFSSTEGSDRPTFTDLAGNRRELTLDHLEDLRAVPEETPTPHWGLAY